MNVVIFPAHYVEGNQGEAADEKSVESIDNMEVSDFEEGGSLADEEGEVEGSHERREHVPKKNVSPPPQSNRSTVSQPHQHTSPMHHTHSHYYDAEPQHQPHPPPAPPQYTPYQSVSDSPFSTIISLHYIFLAHKAGDSVFIYI